MQFDEEFYLRAKERAKPWLFQLPGVLGVGLGPKIVAGKSNLTVACIEVRPLCAKARRLTELRRLSRYIFNVRWMQALLGFSCLSTSKRYASGQSCRYVRPRFE
jgi:hypothetical protein